MKLSKYNFYEKFENMVLIYNTASSNCIVTNEEEYQNFLSLNFNEINFEKYFDYGFYVKKDADELQNLILRSENTMLNSKKNKFRILTTTNCNAKCFYCYEAGIKSSNMNLETADSVVSFILDKSIGKKVIEIEWFGGEPLLNSNVIDYISEKIQKNKPEYTEYRSTMVSNAYLINDSIIKKMKEKWNLHLIQITLDGINEEYEQIKGMGEKSFDKVISNIENLVLNNIKVDIRLNYNSENIDKMKSVIDFVSELSYKDKLFVYPAKINTEEKILEFSLEQETIDLYNYLHQKGLRSKLDLLPKTMKTPCIASHKNYFTIHPSGLLFKCDRKYLEKNSVGSVFNYQEKGLNISSQWNVLPLLSKCEECSLLPLCWGGCVIERINQQDYCHITKNVLQNNLKLMISDFFENRNL